MERLKLMIYIEINKPVLLTFKELQMASLKCSIVTKSEKNGKISSTFIKSHCSKNSIACWILFFSVTTCLAMNKKHTCNWSGIKIFLEQKQRRNIFLTFFSVGVLFCFLIFRHKHQEIKKLRFTIRYDDSTTHNAKFDLMKNFLHRCRSTKQSVYGQRYS